VVADGNRRPHDHAAAGLRRPFRLMHAAAPGIMATSSTRPGTMSRMATAASSSSSGHGPR
jgi:hypothetical protein